MTDVRDPLWWEDRVNVATLAAWLVEHDRIELRDVSQLIESPYQWAPEWYECKWDLDHPAAA